MAFCCFGILGVLQVFGGQCLTILTKTHDPISFQDIFSVYLQNGKFKLGFMSHIKQLKYQSMHTIHQT